MKNQVIEVLNIEHGKRVIEYWKLKGIDVGCKEGIHTREGGCLFTYYGVINGRFDNFDDERVKQGDVEIIELPEEKTFPRRMLVSYDGVEYTERTVVAKLPGNPITPYIAIYNGEEAFFSEGRTYNTSSCKYAKELPEVEEITLEQVCKELGREIKIID